MSKYLVRDVFTFTKDRMKRYQGAWHLEQIPMFPNYVFLESGDEKALAGALEQMRPAVRVMENQDLLLTVGREEEFLLRDLCGPSHHLSVSRGYISNGGIFVTEGPLAGKEHFIRRIDRHKRTAELEIPFLRRRVNFAAGLEITAKNTMTRN